MEINKVIRPFTAQTWGGRRYSVYIHIQYRDQKLSISGVEGPLSSGNCLGSCGQIVMGYDPNSKHYDESIWDGIEFTNGWSKAKAKKLFEIWDRWHLNDMKAECEHQRARGETWTTHPSAICPDCGYRLGSAWLFEEVPGDVLQWLNNLPETDRDPAWV